MSEGVGTMTVTYAGYEIGAGDLRGVPKLAGRDEQQRRHEAQLQAQAAFDARQNGCFGIGTVLRYS